MFGNSTCVSGFTGVSCYGVFFNFQGQDNAYPGVNCSSTANFDPDISGIGVVISFAASAILTTIASITASLLDHIAARRSSILPEKWQPQNISLSLREKCTFFRRILERLILNFADQQLVTGFALLVGAWVKLHSNPVLQQEWKFLETLHFPNIWLPNAQFSLVVFLCMASSSSHLACVLVMREYWEDHISQARLRLFLIVVFAMFLAVTIALASSFTVYFTSILAILFKLTLNSKEYSKSSTYITILALSIAVPVVVILGICWLCTLQLMPDLKVWVREKLRSVLLTRLKKWLRLSKLWHSGLMRLLPASWRKPFTRFVKGCFWFMVIGNEFTVFIIQICLSMLSVIWIALQRLATPPIYHSYFAIYEDGSSKATPLCSLHHVAGKNQWASFGQLLPVILLLLPLLSAYGTYIEERDKKRVTGYASIPGWDWSPSLPQKSSKPTSRSATFRDEAELSLLDNQGRGRHESSGSVTSPFTRAYYGRHESSGSVASPGMIPYAYGDGPSPMLVQSAFSPEVQNSRSQGGYFGWPTGFSTGVEEQQYPFSPNHRW